MKDVSYWFYLCNTNIQHFNTR